MGSAYGSSGTPDDGSGYFYDPFDGSSGAGSPSPGSYGGYGSGAAGGTSSGGYPGYGQPSGGSTIPQYGNSAQQGGYNPGGYGSPQGGGYNPGSYGTPQGGGYHPGGYGSPQGGGYNPGGYGTPQDGGYNPGGYGSSQGGYGAGGYSAPAGSYAPAPARPAPASGAYPVPASPAAPAARAAAPAASYGAPAPGAFSGNVMSVVQTLTGKWSTSATIWSIIGWYQIIVGVVTVFVGYGIVALILGIWNVKNASNLRKAARQYRKNPVGIVRYADSMSSGVVSLLLNLFLGAFFGVIGALYDMGASRYAKANRDLLVQAEQQALGH